MQESIKRMAELVVVTLLVGSTPAVADLTQTANLDMTAGGNDMLPGTGRSFAGYVWTGDGQRLNMGGCYIKNIVDANGFTLNMAGGGITNGGDISTSRADNTGSITVTNAGSMAVGLISTLIPGAYGGASGSINVSHTNSLSASGILTGASGGGYNAIGNITVRGDNSGALTVGANGISSAKPTDGSGGSILIQNYTAVTVNGSIAAPGNGSGTIAIGSSGNHIGGNIAISGGVSNMLSTGSSEGADIGLYANGSVSASDIVAGYSSGWYGNYRSAGSINIVSRGAFTGGSLITGGDRDCPIRSITVDGTDSSGSYVSGGIDGHRSSIAAKHGPAVTIRNYSSVTINGDVRTDVTSATFDGANGGNLTVTNGITGDILITGGINLRTVDITATNGSLSLATTGRLITIGSLELTNVSTVVVSPGSKCIVKGDLTGFTNPATQTQLRLPAGKRMIYYPGRTNNAYLAGAKYVLASPEGTPAAGGVLMPYSSPGTVITLK